MSIRVLRPGALTTVQDRGRFGFQKSGIGTAGAMDIQALDAANAIVGNYAGAACLEMTMLGATLEFDAFAICVLTGADMNAHLGGASLRTYQAFYVLPGQQLVMGGANFGCRAYLAVQGGIAVPQVMNSRSTDLKSHIGGLEGRALKAGDVLPVGREIRRRDPSLKAYPLPEFPREVSVRVILGPQEDYFTSAGLETLFREIYTVSDSSDRMGIRLNGVPVEAKDSVDIVSDAITFGSIQIPKNGLPIILMADHQTTGGYAKPGTVVSEDLSRLAQLRPGDRVRFEKAEIDDIQRKMKRYHHGLF